nr:unnamed protein product [Digitaria exilis]
MDSPEPPPPRPETDASLSRPLISAAPRISVLAAHHTTTHAEVVTPWSGRVFCTPFEAPRRGDGAAPSSCGCDRVNPPACDLFYGVWWLPGWSMGACDSGADMGLGPLGPWPQADLVDSLSSPPQVPRPLAHPRQTQLALSCLTTALWIGRCKKGRPRILSYSRAPTRQIDERRSSAFPSHRPDPLTARLNGQEWPNRRAVRPIDRMHCQIDRLLAPPLGVMDGFVARHRWLVTPAAAVGHDNPDGAGKTKELNNRLSWFGWGLGALGCPFPVEEAVCLSDKSRAAAETDASAPPPLSRQTSRAPLLLRSSASLSRQTSRTQKRSSSPRGGGGAAVPACARPTAVYLGDLRLVASVPLFLAMSVLATVKLLLPDSMDAGSSFACGGRPNRARQEQGGGRLCSALELADMEAKAEVVVLVGGRSNRAAEVVVAEEEDVVRGLAVIALLRHGLHLPRGARFAAASSSLDLCSEEEQELGVAAVVEQELNAVEEQEMRRAGASPGSSFLRLGFSGGAAARAPLSIFCFDLCFDLVSICARFGGFVCDYRGEELLPVRFVVSILHARRRAGAEPGLLDVLLLSFLLFFLLFPCSPLFRSSGRTAEQAEEAEAVVTAAIGGEVGPARCHVYGFGGHGSDRERTGSLPVPRCGDFNRYSDLEVRIESPVRIAVVRIGRSPDAELMPLHGVRGDCARPRVKRRGELARDIQDNTCVATARARGGPARRKLGHMGVRERTEMILLSVEELFGRSLFQLLLLKLDLFQPLLTFTSLLLLLRRRSATFTDFPLLTTPWELAGDA